MSLCSHQGNPSFELLDEPVRARLQAELYALRKHGGPRYPPLSVRKAASAALDALFPQGALMRRVIGLAFYAIHPGDWPVMWIINAVIVRAVMCFRFVAYWTGGLVRPLVNRIKALCNRRRDQ